MALLRKNEKTKHQLRTDQTRSKILDAAEAVFSESGFEKTQLEEIAARAGYTRGAIYAHYASKEDLFLALMEQRVHTKITAARRMIEAEPDSTKRAGLFRKWIACQVSDRSWGTLMLEFKLYALRRPSSSEKLQAMYEMLSQQSGTDFIDLLFGPALDKQERKAAERRLAIMGAILSAVILESHFRPRLLPKAHLHEVLQELFDALIQP
jgi:AcrR family transcriptional regulator